MIPKTEKDLEIYFKLLELTEAKKLVDLPYSLSYPNQQYYIDNFERVKTQYFSLVNSIK